MSGSKTTLLAARQDSEAPRPAQAGPDNRRKPRVYENEDYFRFARRIIEAGARRVAAGDVEALRDLVELEGALKVACQTAVDGLRGQGYSWSEIGARLGVSKMAVCKRWRKSQ